MSSVTNDSFDITLSNQETIDYHIASIDQETGVIILSLSFKDISKISSGSDPDILEVILNEKIEVETANQIFIFKKGLRSSRSIPPLL
jgi:hypothetical protein